MTDINMDYIWDDAELVKAYEIAVKLGSKTKPKLQSHPFELLDDYLNRQAQAISPENENLPPYSDVGTTKDSYDQLDRGYAFQSDYVENGAEPYSETKHWLQEKESGWDVQGNTYGVTAADNNQNKGKQVRFSTKSQGKSKKPNGKRQTVYGDEFSEEYPEDDEEDFSCREPMQMPDWSSSFPSLTAPPMPSSFPLSPHFKKGDMSSLLMAWYNCGYQAGYFDAKQDFNKTSKQ